MSRYNFRNKSRKPVYDESALTQDADERIEAFDPTVTNPYTDLRHDLRKRKHVHNPDDDEVSNPPPPKRRRSKRLQATGGHHENPLASIEPTEVSVTVSIAADDISEEKEKSVSMSTSMRRRSTRLLKKQQDQEQEQHQEQEQGQQNTNTNEGNNSSAEDSEYQQPPDEPESEDVEECTSDEDDDIAPRRRSQRIRDNGKRVAYLENGARIEHVTANEEFENEARKSVSLPIALRRSRRERKRPARYDEYNQPREFWLIPKSKEVKKVTHVRRRNQNRMNSLRPRRQRVCYNEDSDDELETVVTASSLHTRQSAESYDYDSSGSGSVFMSDSEMERRQRRETSTARATIQPINQPPTRAATADITPMEIDLTVDWECVGGLESHIKKLKEMVVLPLLYPQEFAQFKMSPPKGVLFHGPPGTGKTLVARVLAAQCSKHGQKVSFYMRKGADCLSKWVGEAERQLRLLFEEAAKNQPSVIFFDEIDGLAPVRSSRQDQIHSSIVSTLLAMMDGLDNRGQIIVIGATNRPDHIDPALRRPGRFDSELCFQLPSRTARKQILNIHTRSWLPPLGDKLSTYLADKTAGYCGADLEGLCREAFLTAVRRTFPQIYNSNTKVNIDAHNLKVLEQDFECALADIVPSSQRSTLVYARQLSPLLSSLLRTQLAEIKGDIERVFNLRKEEQKETNQMDNRSASVSSDTTELSHPPASNEDLSDYTEIQRKNQLKRKLCTRHYRYLIHGPDQRFGQTHLGCAVLHLLEEYPLYSLDLPSLIGDTSTKCAEESCLQVLKEAKGNAPSVIFWPHIDRWWASASQNSLKTCITLLFDDIPHLTPIFVVATCDVPVEDLDPVLQSLFNQYYCYDCNQEIPKSHRFEFWSQLKHHFFECHNQEIEPSQSPSPNEDCVVTENQMSAIRLRTHIRSICNRLCKQFVEITTKCGLTENVITTAYNALMDIREDNDNDDCPSVDRFLQQLKSFVTNVKDKTYFNSGSESDSEELAALESIDFRHFVSHLNQLHDDALIMLSNIDPQLVKQCNYLAALSMQNSNSNSNSNSNDESEEIGAEPRRILRRSTRISSKERKSEAVNDELEQFDLQKLDEMILKLVTISVEFTIDEFEEKMQSLLRIVHEYHNQYDTMIDELQYFIASYIRDPASDAHAIC